MTSGVRTAQVNPTLQWVGGNLHARGCKFNILAVEQAGSYKFLPGGTQVVVPPIWHFHPVIMPRIASCLMMLQPAAVTTLVLYSRLSLSLSTSFCTLGSRCTSAHWHPISKI